MFIWIFGGWLMTRTLIHAHSQPLDRECIYHLFGRLTAPTSKAVINLNKEVLCLCRDGLGRLLKLTGFVRSKLWLSLGMHERSHVTVNCMIDNRAGNGYLSCDGMCRPEAQWLFTHGICLVSSHARDVKSGEKLWMYLSVDRNAAAPDSFVKLTLIVQGLYGKVER